MADLKINARERKTGLTKKFVKGVDKGGEGSKDLT